MFHVEHFTLPTPFKDRELSCLWFVRFDKDRQGKMVTISYGSFEMKISTFLRKIKIAVSIIECCMVSSDAFFTSSADTLNFRATNWASSISSSENLLNLLIMKSNGWSTLISNKLSLYIVVILSLYPGGMDITDHLD